MPKRTVKEPHGTAHLIWAVEGKSGVIKINGVCYKIEYLLTDAPTPRHVYRLTKPDGTTTYDVHYDERYGDMCSCPSFIFNHTNAPTVCKHIAALRAVAVIGKVVEAK